MNIYEQRARTVKSVHIADVLTRLAVTADEAQDWPQRLRLAAARAAQQRPPSDTTWDEVVSWLRSRERQAERVEEVVAHFA